MTKRSSAPARVLAVIALVLSFVVLIVMVAAALDEGGSSGTAGGHGHPASHEHGQVKKKAPATYTIQSGDTLTAIAHKTGVPVARIERLNPGIDPQILISGEELKLR